MVLTSPKHRCEGLTATSSRCRRYAARDADENGKYYCKVHLKQSYVQNSLKSTKRTRKTFCPKIGDTRCSICLEDVVLDDDAGLECGHWGHLSCIKQMHRALCPLCKHVISNKSRLTSRDLQTINKRTRKEENEERERQRIATERALREFREEDMVARFVDIFLRGVPLRPEGGMFISMGGSYNGDIFAVYSVNHQ